MLEFNGYNVYVKINDDSKIVAVNSSAFINDYTDWILIESNVYGDKGHHAQGNYFPECIITDSGAYRYKLVDGKPVECTVEEISEQENVEVINTPSQLDIIEAQVTYTAMMTDTLLEV